MFISASHAIRTMNGTVVGSQTISVTLHEPRKIRPEKLAERQAMETSVHYGRQGHMSRRSASPIRTDRRGRSERTSDEPRVNIPLSLSLILYRHLRHPTISVCSVLSYARSLWQSGSPHESSSTLEAKRSPTDTLSAPSRPLSAMTLH